MASMGLLHFQTPLSLYVSAISRLRAIASALRLERQRGERKRDLAQYKADRRHLIGDHKPTSEGERP